MLVLGIIVFSLISIFCWSCFGYVYEYSEQQKGGVQIFLAIVFTVLSVLMFYTQITFSYAGYSIDQSLLPIHGVCEVVYIGEDVTIDTDSILYPTLIKLPDNQYRLFNLDKKMTLGLVKVMPDYQLIPFLPIPAGNPFP